MILYSGGNGASLESAMIILGAKTEAEGIKAEHFMINRCFDIIKKSYRILRQQRYHIEGKSYDRKVIQDEDMEIDISEYLLIRVYENRSDFCSKIHINSL